MAELDRLERTAMAYGDQGLCFVNPVVCIGNIDRQDKQDKKRLRAMLTGSMIGCAFEVIHEPGSEFLESATEKAMMMGLSEARLSVQSHNPVKVRFREKPVGDKPSCLSCPSMSIDLLMLDAKTQRQEHNFVTLV